MIDILMEMSPRTIGWTLLGIGSIAFITIWADDLRRIVNTQADEREQSFQDKPTPKRRRTDWIED